MGAGIMAYQYDAELLEDFFHYETKRAQTDRPLTRAGSRRRVSPVRDTISVLRPRLKNLEKEQKGMIKTSYIELMKDFFDGKISDENPSFMYWYFLEILMMQTKFSAGEKTSMLNNSEWYPSPSVPYASIPELKLYDFEPFDVLDVPEDFPLVLRARYENLESLAKKIDLVSDDLEQKNQFLGWIDKARSNQFDLFLFYY